MFLPNFSNIALSNNLPSWVKNYYGPIAPYIDAALHYDTQQYWVRGLGECNWEDVHSLSRASASSAENVDSSITTFSSGVPAITDQGWSIYEARTNVVKNSSMTGAVVGTPGTLHF